MKPTLLLLGGTREAREFAEQFDDVRFRLVASLAGVTRNPVDYPCETRIGGFGGSGKMAEWVQAEKVLAIVDATHPFAAQISANAQEAAALAGVKILVLRRGAWKVEDGWREFLDEQTLAEAIPFGARVLLTSGRGDLEAYRKRTDVDFILRSIEPLPALPEHIRSVLKRPPYSFEDDYALLQRNEITHIVTKNSGGARPAKLDAAAALGVQVFCLKMPPEPSGPMVQTVTEALNWAYRPMP